MQLAFPLTLAVNGVPCPNAKPTWVCWQLMSNGAPLPPPTIVDHGNGQYAYYWDADKYGEARGVIDWGSLMGAARYSFEAATSESSRILAGIAKAVTALGAQQESRP